VNQYSRSDVQRILRVTNRQLLHWERAGLVPAADHYSFSDLLQIRKIRELCAQRIRPAVIRQSIQEMRKVAGMSNPLLEASATPAYIGRRLAFRHGGTMVEPIAGQFVLDFDAPANTEMRTTAKSTVSTPVEPISSSALIAELFARGVMLEEDQATHNEAISCYAKVIELDPLHAAAHINLGTLYYNRHEYAKAEQFYRLAATADPQYALAYFDLGNVLDETGRLHEAVDAYREAIKLANGYADAHYNVALAYEKLKQPRLALRHWQCYLKLDGSGPWAAHARTQIKRILKDDTLSIVKSLTRNN